MAIYKNELFSKQNHLISILMMNEYTDIYNAVSKCTRCGYCLEKCPTYVIWKDEALSPRGRNRIVRLLIEGKYQNVNSASKSIDSCLLCSACSDICYGEVPTAEIVLEARREKKNFGKSLILNYILRLREKEKIFDLILKLLYLIQKLGLTKLADKIGIFDIIGYPSLSQASRKVFSPPLKFLHEEINHLSKSEKISWIYFLTCGTDLIFPNVGKATINILKKIYGEGIYMNNKCCGLISYNYGNLKDAQKLATKNIEIYLELKKKYKDFFIVLDCSSCAAFLKKYPQLLYGTQYHEKAIEFASKVKDIIEIIKPEHINISHLPKFLNDKKVTIHHSCKAYNEEKIKTQQYKVLKPILGDNLVDLSEIMCCGGAGAYSFTNPSYSEEILKRKMINIASTHADYTIVSSTSCMMQLGYGRKNLYPSTYIIHYSEFIDMLQKE